MARPRDAITRFMYGGQRPPDSAAGQAGYLRGQGLSTRQIAVELGVSQRTVQKWAAGTQRPRPETGARLAGRVRRDMAARQVGRVRGATTQATGLRVRGRMGPALGPGYIKNRSANLRLTEDQAGRLAAAAEAGDEEAMAAVLQEAADSYLASTFGTGGPGLTIEDITGIE